MNVGGGLAVGGAPEADGLIEVSGPLGRACLHPQAPAEVVAKVRELLAGDPAAGTPAPDAGSSGVPPEAPGRSAATADAPEGEDGGPVLEDAPMTMTWSEEDEARASAAQTGVWVEAAIAPPPAPAYPEPEPGSGRRRHRPASTPHSPDGTADAPSSAQVPQSLTVPVPVPPGMVVPAPSGLPAPVIQVGPPDAVPLVWGSVCAAGHVNPLDADRCLSCCAALTGERRQVPTPVLMVLSLSTGQRVPVRSEVVIGRAPQAMTGATGTTLLVPVDSPTRLVSRSHLLISTAGWSVLARDLGSHNGTVLLRPGIAPVLLGSAMPSPLLVGDLLDIGDGVTIRLDPYA